MSEEIVLESGVKTKIRKVILKREVVTKTEKITQEFELGETEAPIRRSVEVAPLVLAGRFRPRETVESMSLDDLECRKELKKLLGLQSLPERIEESFDNLYGLFDDLLEPDEEVDTTKWVKSLRRRI